MTEKKARAYSLEDADGIGRAYADLVIEVCDGYTVQLPSEGDRVVVVTSREDATVIAEAEVLRQMLADETAMPARSEAVRAPTREPLDVAAGRLLVENADGTCSIRIPCEGGRVVTVTDSGDAWVIAMAAAAQQRLAELDTEA